MKSIVRCSKLAVLIVLFFGCGASGRDANSVVGLTAPGPSVRPEHPAVSAITRARCERVQRCPIENTSPVFDERVDCMDAMRIDTYAEIARCPQDVEEEALRRCLSSIDAARCPTNEGGLASVPDCDAAWLCPN